MSQRAAIIRGMKSDTQRPLSVRLAQLRRCLAEGKVTEAVLVRTAAECTMKDLRARQVFAFVDGRAPLYEVLVSTGLPIDEAVTGLILLYTQQLVALEVRAVPASA